ncbi:hypothetical protein Rs2_16595 [Raphanus sativus]|nr:hypothetical protein Rs2_16595 [Raphanus sativus]
MQENRREESPWRREGTRTLLTVERKSRGEESPWRREPSRGIAVERIRRGEQNRSDQSCREESVERKSRRKEEPSKGRAVESWIRPINRLESPSRENQRDEKQRETE